MPPRAYAFLPFSEYILPLGFEETLGGSSDCRADEGRISAAKSTMEALDKNDDYSAGSLDDLDLDDIIDLEKDLKDDALVGATNSLSSFGNLSTNNEAAEDPPLTERDLQELPYLLTDSEIVVTLAWILKTTKSSLLKSNPMVKAFIDDHQGDGTIPVPSERVCTFFQDQCHFDVRTWYKDVKERQGHEHDSKIEIEKKTKGKQVCSICRKLREDHICNPTRLQVQAHISRLVTVMRTEQRTSVESGKYTCNKCGEIKKNHICKSDPYKRIAVDVVKKARASNGDPNVETMIREQIKRSNFQFDGDGRRMVAQVPAPAVSEESVRRLIAVAVQGTSNHDHSLEESTPAKRKKLAPSDDSRKPSAK